MLKILKNSSKYKQIEIWSFNNAKKARKSGKCKNRNNKSLIMGKKLQKLKKCKICGKKV
jgi:hypothetical protein